MSDRRCPLDTDGDGNCAACAHGGAGYPGCVNGLVAYPATPELDKMLACTERSAVLQEFVDWLNEERGYSICEQRPSGMSTATEELDEWWPASYGGYNKLFADFFGIDLQKVEEERRAVLAHLRDTV